MDQTQPVQKETIHEINDEAYFGIVADLEVEEQVDLGPALVVSGFHPTLGRISLVSTAEGKHAIIQ